MHLSPVAIHTYSDVHGFFEWLDTGVFVYDDRYVFAYDKDLVYIPLYKDSFTYKVCKRIYLIWLPYIT